MDTFRALEDAVTDHRFPVWDGERWWTRRELIEDVLNSVMKSDAF